MKYPQRLFLLALSAAALVLHGCSCSSSRSRIDSGTPPPTFQLSGMASKGILINAQVNAYRIVDGAPHSSPIATGATNNQGSYSLSIPQTQLNDPLLIRVTALADGTFMRCDLANGCGDGIDFGEDLHIGADEGFELESLIIEAAANQPANITLLTHLAAKQAQASGLPSELNALRQAIAEANSKIANRFGITGNLTSAPVIDLTNAAAVNAALSANSQAIHIAAINAALVQAQRVKNPGASIANAASGFTSAFVQRNGLAGNTTSATMPGYNEILQAAQNILTRVQLLTPQTPINLGPLLAELAAQEQLAANEPPDTFNPGTPSETGDLPALEKVKAMVADLRDLSLSIGGAELEGGETLRSAAEEFHLQLEAAEMATSVDMYYLVDALAKTAEAVEEADRAYRADSALLNYEHAGILVHIETIDEVPHYSVDQDVAVEHEGSTAWVTTDITASWVLDTENSEADNEESVSGSGMANLTGSMESDHLHMTIHQDSHVTLDAVISQVEGGEHTQVDVDMVHMELNVTLSEHHEDNPVTLSAHIELEVATLTGEELDTMTDTSFRVMPTTLSLRIAGEVSNEMGDAYHFALAAQGDARGSLFEDGDLQESAAEFAEFTASVIFNANLAGIPDVVVASYNLVRTGLDSGQNTLTLRYFPGKLLRMQAPVVDGELSRTVTVTNQDGVVLTLLETEDATGQTELEGNITLNGTEYATIEQSSSDVIIIRYTDETFESI